MVKRIEETVLLASKRGEEKYFKRVKYLNVYLHVFVRTNDRGRFIELRMPNYSASSDFFLKVPEEDSAGCGWGIFVNELGRFIKKKRGDRGNVS